MDDSKIYDFSLKVAKGQVYTGKQAKELDLIDILGTFEDSVNLMLLLTGNINKTASLIEPENNDDNFISNFLNQLYDISMNKMLLFPLPEFKLYYDSY